MQLGNELRSYSNTLLSGGHQLPRKGYIKSFLLVTQFRKTAQRILTVSLKKYKLRMKRVLQSNQGNYSSQFYQADSC